MLTRALLTKITRVLALKQQQQAKQKWCIISQEISSQVDFLKTPMMQLSSGKRAVGGVLLGDDFTQSSLHIPQTLAMTDGAHVQARCHSQTHH